MPDQMGPKFLLRNSLVKRRRFSGTYAHCHTFSEVQQIVCWAVGAELAKREKRAENGCMLLTQMIATLTKMRVLCSDMERCIEYTLHNEMGPRGAPMGAPVCVPPVSHVL
jgi:hypothetical protein